MTRLKPGLLVAALAVLLYLPSLSAPFFYDDYTHFVENVKVRHPKSVCDIFYSGWQETRPLYNLSLYGQAVLFGTSPVAGHAINVLLHVAVVFLSFLLFQRLGASSAIATLATMLWAIHPVGVETVAYMNSRSGLLAALLSFLGWLLVLRPGRRGWLPACLCFVLAMMSKEEAAAAPLIAILLLWTKSRDEEIPRPTFVSMIAIASTWLTIPLLFLLFRSPHVGTAGAEVSPWWVYLWHQGTNLPLHFSQFIFPWPLTLDRDLPTWAYSPVVILLGWMALAAWIAIAWRQNRTPLGIGMAAAILALLPTHSIVPLLDVHASRFFYPMLPWCALAAGSAISRLNLNTARWRALALAILFPMTVLTAFHIHRWQDPLRVWQADVKAAPSRWRAWLNYGVELGERARWSEATDALDRAYAIEPTQPSVPYNQAVVAYVRQDGKQDLAFTELKLQETLRLNPEHARAKKLLEKLIHSPPLFPRRDRR